MKNATSRATIGDDEPTVFDLDSADRRVPPALRNTVGSRKSRVSSQRLTLNRPGLTLEESRDHSERQGLNFPTSPHQSPGSKAATQQMQASSISNSGGRVNDMVETWQDPLPPPIGHMKRRESKYYKDGIESRLDSLLRIWQGELAVAMDVLTTREYQDRPLLSHVRAAHCVMMQWILDDDMDPDLAKPVYERYKIAEDICSRAATAALTTSLVVAIPRPVQTIPPTLLTPTSSSGRSSTSIRRSIGNIASILAVGSTAKGLSSIAASRKPSQASMVNRGSFALSNPSHVSHGNLSLGGLDSTLRSLARDPPNHPPPPSGNPNEIDSVGLGALCALACGFVQIYVGNDKQATIHLRRAIQMVRRMDFEDYPHRSFIMQDGVNMGQNTNLAYSEIVLGCLEMGMGYAPEWVRRICQDLMGLVWNPKQGMLRLLRVMRTSHPWGEVHNLSRLFLAAYALYISDHEYRPDRAVYLQYALEALGVDMKSPATVVQTPTDASSPQPAPPRGSWPIFMWYHAKCLSRLGRCKEAEAMLRQVMTIRGRDSRLPGTRLPTSSPSVHASLKSIGTGIAHLARDIAMLLFAQGDWSGCIRYIRSCGFLMRLNQGGYDTVTHAQDAMMLAACYEMISDRLQAMNWTSSVPSPELISSNTKVLVYAIAYFGGVFEWVDHEVWATTRLAQSKFASEWLDSTTRQLETVLYDSEICLVHPDPERHMTRRQARDDMLICALLCGAAYTAKGEYKKAENVLNKLFANIPPNRLTWWYCAFGQYERGSLYLRQEKYLQAHAYFSEALKVSRTPAPLMRRLGKNPTLTNVGSLIPFRDALETRCVKALRYMELRESDVSSMMTSDEWQGHEDELGQHFSGAAGAVVVDGGDGFAAASNITPRMKMMTPRSDVGTGISQGRRRPGQFSDIQIEPGKTHRISFNLSSGEHLDYSWTLIAHDILFSVESSPITDFHQPSLSSAPTTIRPDNGGSDGSGPKRILFGHILDDFYVASDVCELTLAWSNTTPNATERTRSIRFAYTLSHSTTETTPTWPAAGDRSQVQTAATLHADRIVQQSDLVSQASDQSQENSEEDSRYRAISFPQSRSDSPQTIGVVQQQQPEDEPDEEKDPNDLRPLHQQKNDGSCSIRWVDTLTVVETSADDLPTPIELYKADAHNVSTSEEPQNPIVAELQDSDLLRVQQVNGFSDNVNVETLSTLCTNKKEEIEEDPDFSLL